MNQKSKLFNLLTQFALPILTIATQVAIATKQPKWGLVINMTAQPFWLYTSWRAYREAGQIGLLITSSIVTVIIGLGIINYFFNPF